MILNQRFSVYIALLLSVYSGTAYCESPVVNLVIEGDSSPSAVVNQGETADSPDSMEESGNQVIRAAHPSRTVDEIPSGYRIRNYAKPDKVALKASVKNIKIGENFLSINRAQPGVIELPDGLQYRFIKPSNGIKPTANDVVKCVFKGMLIDGSVFESSQEKAAYVSLKPLVPGLREAITLMPVGAKIEAVIPPSIGYGMNGKPPKVGPNMVVIYTIDLLEIGQPSPKK